MSEKLECRITFCLTRAVYLKDLGVSNKETRNQSEKVTFEVCKKYNTI